LNNRFVATAIATGAIAWFAFYKIDGKPAGLALWTLFGVTNQLLAGLTLLVVTLYLYQRGRNIWFTGLPMVFMLVSTFTAIVEQVLEFRAAKQNLLLIVALALAAVGLGVVVEGLIAFRRRERFSDDAITFAGGV
jgi:carbon starvation protein